MTDVFGNPVGPVTTDADGLYLFPNLPAGTTYTVAIDLTLTAVAELAGIVAIRTFLSWTIEPETEGRWPWRATSASDAGESAG